MENATEKLQACVTGYQARTKTHTAIALLICLSSDQNVMHSKT